MPMSDPVFYRAAEVDGLSIFCRDAGPKMAQRFSCSTACPPLHECSSRSSPPFQSLSPSRPRLPGLRAYVLVMSVTTPTPIVTTRSADDEYSFLNKPGQADIQSDLIYDYRSNVDGYPKWQAWMCESSRAYW
jgi:hypothetical protein